MTPRPPGLLALLLDFNPFGRALETETGYGVGEDRTLDEKKAPLNPIVSSSTPRFFFVFSKERGTCRYGAPPTSSSPPGFAPPLAFSVIQVLFVPFFREIRAWGWKRGFVVEISVVSICYAPFDSSFFLFLLRPLEWSGRYWILSSAK